MVFSQSMEMLWRYWSARVSHTYINTTKHYTVCKMSQIWKQGNFQHIYPLPPLFGNTHRESGHCFQGVVPLQSKTTQKQSTCKPKAYFLVYCCLRVLGPCRHLIHTCWKPFLPREGSIVNFNLVSTPAIHGGQSVRQRWPYKDVSSVAAGVSLTNKWRVVA